MPWYRGVTCKNCDSKIALKRLSGPEEGPLDSRGSSSWRGAGVQCKKCGVTKFYTAPDFLVFEVLEPLRNDPSRKPN